MASSTTTIVFTERAIQEGRTLFAGDARARTFRIEAILFDEITHRFDDASKHCIFYQTTEPAVWLNTRFFALVTELEDNLVRVDRIIADDPDLRAQRWRARAGLERRRGPFVLGRNRPARPVVGMPPAASPSRPIPASVNTTAVPTPSSRVVEQEKLVQLLEEIATWLPHEPSDTLRRIGLMPQGEWSSSVLRSAELLAQSLHMKRGLDSATQAVDALADLSERYEQVTGAEVVTSEELAAARSVRLSKELLQALRSRNLLTITLTINTLTLLADEPRSLQKATPLETSAENPPDTIAELPPASVSATDRPPPSSQASRRGSRLEGSGNQVAMIDESHLEMTVTSLEPDLSRLEQMVNRLRRASLPPVGQQARALVARIEHATAQLQSRPLVTSRLDAVRRELQRTSLWLEALSRELPVQATLEQVRHQLVDLETRWSQSTPEEIDEVATRIEEMAPPRSWEQVIEAEAVSRDERLPHLPSWLWPKELQPGVKRGAHWVTVFLLDDATLRHDIRACLEVAHSSPLDDQTLSLLPEPEERGSPRERLEIAITQGDIPHRIQLLPVFVSDQRRGDLMERYRDSGERSELVALETLCRQVEEWTAQLHPSAVLELHARFEKSDEAVSEALDSVERVSTKLGGAELLRTIGSLDAICRLGKQTKRPSNKPPPARPLTVTITHPMSRASASHYSAMLVWSPLADLKTLGTIALPLRLTCEVAPGEDTELEIVLEIVDRALTEGITEERRTEHTTRLVKLSAGRTVQDVEVVVLLRQPRKELVLAASLRQREERVGGPTRMSWSSVSGGMPSLNILSFPQQVDASRIMGTPVGSIERDFDDILEVVTRGETSFMISGYRRFGKSSVVRALHERANPIAGQTGVWVLGCFNAATEPVWEAIATSLEDVFKRPVRMTGDQLVPGTSDYHEALRGARQQGYKAVYVLIDEAQELFSDSTARIRSERLKGLLEEAWKPTEDRAALRLGFVGQFRLPKLMSANLYAAIARQWRTKLLGDDDLVAILRDSSSDGLQSTAQARQALAHMAGNLYLLDQLLLRVLRRLKDHQRTWLIEDDVRSVVSELIESQDDSAWRYVRDPLNESSELDDWRPSEVYPVALALARSLQEGHVPDEQGNPTARMEELLSTWSGSEYVHRERTREALERLRKDEILNAQYRFSMPLLGRMLASRAHRPNPLSEPVEQEALVRLGLRRIRLSPAAMPTASPSFTGGQATVFRAEDPQRGVVAVRLVQLKSAESTHRFMREIDAFERMEAARANGVAGWHTASQSVPQFVEAGLLDSDSRTGVLLYHWIDGHTPRRETMSAAAVVMLGQRMAFLLIQLAELGVFHRDIRPENIVLRTDSDIAREEHINLQPVLIDFGLARQGVSASGKRSEVLGVQEFLPPEVVRTNDSSQWTSKGDVYSLGMTLLQCLHPEDHGPLSQNLRDILGQCLEPLEKRLSAQQLHDALQQLRTQVMQEQAIQGARQQARTLLADIPQNFRDALRSVIEHAQNDLTLILLGMMGAPELRATSLASFMENAFRKVIERDPALDRIFQEQRQLNGRTTYLCLAPDLLSHSTRPEFAPFCCREADAVGKLRNAHAHPDRYNEMLSRAVQALPGSRPSEVNILPAVHRSLQRVASAFDTFLETPATPFAHLASAWLGAPLASPIAQLPRSASLS